MEIKRLELEFVFEKLGVFRRESERYVTGVFVVEGIEGLFLHFERSEDILRGHIAERQLGQFFLDQAEFRALVGCTMSREAYTALVLSRVVSMQRE
jgi:hypothetical protein